MAVKIEWVLSIVIISILAFAYDFKVNNQALQQHMRVSKNLEFYDISFSKVDTDTLISVVDTAYGVLYGDVLNAYDIRYKDKHIDNLLAKKAVFIKDYLYLEDGISLSQKDGFSCIAQSAIYDKNLSVLRIPSLFEAKLNTNLFKGKELIYDIQDKILKASDIQASLEL